MTAIELEAQDRAIANSDRGTAFSSVACFEGAQRMAKLLASSDLVPAQYKNSIPNSIIALEMAQRLDMNPLMVMQNLYMVHNKPAWSSSFLIACINGCGRFSSLRYEFTGAEGSDERTCVAWSCEKGSTEKLLGPPVSIKIAKAEGWFNKNGSKWQTMPELMLRYRAATFFARTYCPELTMGMRTQEELHDVDAKETEVAVVETKAAAVHEKMLKRREERVASAEAAVVPAAGADEEKPNPNCPDCGATPGMKHTKDCPYYTSMEKDCRNEHGATPEQVEAVGKPLPRNAATAKASGDVSEARRVAWINDALVFADSETAQALRDLMDGRTPQQIAGDNEGYAVFRAKAKAMIDAGKK
jgi:hypothetical protein